MCNMIFLDYMTGHMAFHNFKWSNTNEAREKEKKQGRKLSRENRK